MISISNTRLSAAIVFAVCGLSWFPIVIAEEKPPPSDAVSAETKERVAWEAFAKSLKTDAFAKDYAGPVRDLDSGDGPKTTTALNVLGASGAIEAIPYIVPFLDSQDATIRVHAGSNLERVVSGIELKRRDRTQPDRIVLRPRVAGDPDLTPLRWVLRKMLAAGDDGSTASYAATMVAYIGLPEFEKELRSLLSSRHPAVKRSAAYALQTLGFNVEQ